MQSPKKGYLVPNRKRLKKLVIIGKFPGFICHVSLCFGVSCYLTFSVSLILGHLTELSAKKCVASSENEINHYIEFMQQKHEHMKTGV